MDQGWVSNSTMVRPDDMVTDLVTKSEVAKQVTSSSQIVEKYAEVVYGSVKEIIFLNLCTEAEAIDRIA